MTGDTSDDYRIVTVVLRKLRPLSAIVDRPRGAGEIAIPRSLIHGADDRMLDGLFAGERVTLRLRAWKAEELGLA